MVSCVDQIVRGNLALTQGESLVLVVDRYGGKTDENNRFM
jgi:hypothetical protein